MPTVRFRILGQSDRVIHEQIDIEQISTKEFTTMSDVSRRNFLKTSAATTALAGALASPAIVRAQGGNDKIRIGFIGPAVADSVPMSKRWQNGQ